MRILITGSSGMLGRSVLHQISRTHHEVFTPSSSELDLKNQLETTNYLRDLKPDAIIHCAALVGGIQANIDNPIDYLVVNLKIDSNLLTAASEISTRNLIYIGSSCMYPKGINLPMSESLIGTGNLEETNEGYALAKIVGAKTIELTSRMKKLNWRTLVLSNLYGPGDHFEPNRSHLVAAIIQKVIAAKESGSSKIEMWGDGKARREFTFIDDVACFMAEKVDSLIEFPETMNLGAGYDLTVLEYYRLVMKICDYEGIIEHNSTKPSGMHRKLMDISKAKSFGWEPKTKIEDGLKVTLKWYLEETSRK
jgi:nucleoside-diphosphate-sugar epimerase